MTSINYFFDTETLPDQAVHMYELLKATIVCYEGGQSFMQGERIRHDILHAMIESANQRRMQSFAYETHKVLPAHFMPDRLEEVQDDIYRAYPSNAQGLWFRRADAIQCVKDVLTSNQSTYQQDDIEKFAFAFMVLMARGEDAEKYINQQAERFDLPDPDDYLKHIDYLRALNIQTPPPHFDWTPK